MTRPDLTIEQREAAKAAAALAIAGYFHDAPDPEECAEQVIDDLWAAGWRPVGALPDERRPAIAGRLAPVPPPDAQTALEQARSRARQHAAQIAAKEAATDAEK